MKQCPQLNGFSFETRTQRLRNHSRSRSSHLSERTMTTDSFLPVYSHPEGTSTNNQKNSLHKLKNSGLFITTNSQFVRDSPYQTRCFIYRKVKLCFSSSLQFLKMYHKIFLFLFCIFFGLVVFITADFIFEPFLEENLLYESIPFSKAEGGSTFAKAAVSTECYPCSLIGRDILLAGGNAIDSAIASMLCIGVIDSFSAGLGGGGFLLVRLSDGTSEAIDFRESAPGSANENMFTEKPEDAIFGVRSIAIPGELKGFEEAHQKFGKLAWAKLFKPSIQLARNGFIVTPELGRRLAKFEKEILSNPTLRPTYAPQNKILREGDICYRKNLAKTLEILAASGNSDPFYKGIIRDSLLKFIEAMTPLRRLKGPLITKEDFESYAIKRRKILVGKFYDKQVLVISSPSSGSALLEALNLLQLLDNDLESSSPENLLLESTIEKNGSIENSREATAQSSSISIPTSLDWHLFSEVCKHVFSARSRLYDPMNMTEVEDVSALEDRISSVDFAASIKKKIKENRTFPPNYYGLPESDLPQDHGTAHVSVMDEQGNSVSMMSTVNLVFGSQLMDPETGILLNDEMCDFDISGSVPSFDKNFGKSSSKVSSGDPDFKLPPTLHNKPQPGKRPLSSSVPLILVDKASRTELVIGAAGGPRILTAVLQTLWLKYKFNWTLRNSVMYPRLHHQLIPNKVFLEPGFPPAVIESLERRGHRIDAQSVEKKVGSSVHVIYKNYKLKNMPTGLIEAEADPRKGGKPAGY